MTILFDILYSQMAWHLKMMKVLAFSGLLGAPSAMGAVNAINGNQAFMAAIGQQLGKIQPALDSLSPQSRCDRPLLRRIGDGVASSGGNAHEYRKNGPACFLGKDQVIRACVIMSDGFGVSKTESASTFQAAFNKWVEYIRAAGLQGGTENAAGQFSTKLEIHENCDGSEDLKVIFGEKEDVEVNRIREKYPDPWGFEDCVPDKEKFGHGRSIVWIAPPHSIDNFSPDWTGKNRLLGILLHELGHMFGTGVIPGTIMREDLTPLLQAQPDALLSDKLAEIDQERVLVHGDQDEHRVVVADDRLQYRFGFTFRRLMGRPARGRIHEQLDLKHEKGRLTGNLVLSDGVGKSESFRLDAKLITNPCPTAGIEGAFTRSYPNRGSSGIFSTTCARFGTLTDKRGKSYSVGLVSDTDMFRYQMTLFSEDDLEKSEIFTDAPYDSPMFSKRLPDGTTQYFFPEPPAGDYPYP